MKIFRDELRKREFVVTAECFNRIVLVADDARWLRDRHANITVPGVSGANIIASTDLAMIPEVIDAADLGED